MSRTIVLMLIMAAFSVNAFGDQDYDACLKQEQSLRSKVVDQCSGIKYTFNPSGCFSARRVLKEFEEGRCRKTGAADKGSFKEHSNKTIPKDPPVAAPPVTSPLRVNPLITPAADTLPQQAGETEKLREENARIKAENEKLKSEMEQLRGTSNK